MRIQKSNFLALFFFLMLPFSFLNSCSAVAEPKGDADALVAGLPDLVGVDISKTRIVIDKSDYKLRLYEGSKLIRTYAVVFGSDPVRDKRCEGDRRTPEGKFKVRTKYPHAKWSKFIWIDYPTADSYRKFNASKAKGEIPKDATIGGDVGIHGVPEGSNSLIKDKVNWTWGCISMTRPHVDELFTLIQDGTDILIQP